MRSDLDGTNPAYAPGFRTTKGYCFWRASPAAVKRGYKPTRMKLPGRMGDGCDLQRAQMCRDFQREMLRWMNEGPKIHFPRDTWGWLIRRYLSDEISPFWDTKANTRDSYREVIERWEKAIGNTLIGATDFQRIRLWQKAMKDKGRSTSYINRMFTHLRIVASYGVAIRATGADAVKAILAEMRFKGAPPRSASPTGTQIAAIIAKADEAGERAFALGLTLQWSLTLRAVDVRGQWLRMRKGESPSGITRGAFRWADGLTWDMIDRDMTTISKVPSKTADSLPEMLTFDISPLTDLRARLQAIPGRVGPVIVDPRSGLPYRKEAWSALFRRFRDAAGVSSHITMMDTRAGAINDAKRLGASKIEMQHQANHASDSTTERYIRGRSDAVNRVIQIRAGTPAN